MAHIIPITDANDPGWTCSPGSPRPSCATSWNRKRGSSLPKAPKSLPWPWTLGYTPLALLMEERQLEGPARDLLPRCEPAPVYTGARDVLASLTGYALTRGVLCAFRLPALPTVEDVCAGARRVAVLEGIVDTTNVGAIFRSAAALHVDGVLLSPTCCDPFNRRAVRVSMGTVFQVPWTYLETQASHWPQADWTGSTPWGSTPWPWPSATRPGPSTTPSCSPGKSWPSSWAPRGGRSGPRHHRAL